jgi:predicted nucleic acid-binding protein
MQELFLDTNIVVDYLINREPFSQSALRLFSLAEKRFSIFNYQSDVAG